MGVPNILDYGTSPRVSATFNRYWKVAKVHRINMSGGGNYKHVFKMNYKKVCEKGRWSNEYVTPYTHLYMAVCRAYPAVANVKEDPNPNPVRYLTSAPVCVKMVGYKKYKFRPITSTRPITYHTRNIQNMNVFSKPDVIW